MSDLLDPVILQMLAAMEPVLKAYNVEFYLVGAVARDIHFSKHPQLASKRATLDIDFAIMVDNEDQFYYIKDALLETGAFTAHETEAIKLFYKNSIEIDLLPFGGIENEGRETRLYKPRLFALDVPGFLEVLPAVETIQVSKDISINVCSLEGLVLLKLVAWDDKPSRTKDITDIEHIINCYADLWDVEIFQEYMDVMELYDTAANAFLQLVAARIIGRKISALLINSVELHHRVTRIACSRAEQTWQALAEGLVDLGS